VNRAQSSGNRLFDPDDNDRRRRRRLPDGRRRRGRLGSRRRATACASRLAEPHFPAAVDPTGDVASDQAVYVEGNYNTGGGAQLVRVASEGAAALMATR
jgi:hypothetical protein